IGKVAGVELTEDQITQLLNEKHTDEIQGFLSKKGNLFSAKLKLDEQFRAAFDFESNNTAPAAPTAEAPAASPEAPVAPEAPEVAQEASTPAPASSADDDLAAFLAAEEAAVDVDLEHELFG
ncbi:MAG: topoisomerase C-terminal repeat-containing protein, partial [Lachnospiraceae bacterium]|nr:topoisomerase C-terminal repeat-containing protein [Lachnospiraceae bacterium]